MSTQAKGMVMTYDGEQLEFVYGGYAHSVNGDGFERVNTAVVIYETMEYLETQPQTESKKTESGYKYSGRISSGDFILTQREDNSLDTLTIRSADYCIEFK